MYYFIDKQEQLQSKLKAIGTLIGNTPLHRVGQLYQKKNVTILAKKEWEQLSASVKARAAYYIIQNAVLKGDLHRGKQLLDATSGNTGIAYARIARHLEIPVTLCLPENASEERKKILTSLDVNIVYTSKFEGTDGAQAMARSLAEQYPDTYFYADQYNNPNNLRAHIEGTAREIERQVPDITHFITGVGTTGSFTGIATRLRASLPQVKCIALHPDNPMHGLEGWKHLETAVVPGIYNADMAHEHHFVDTEYAFHILRESYYKEGLSLSPSAAANLAGAIQLAKSIDKGVIVTLLPDNADKYSEVIKKIFQ